MFLRALSWVPPLGAADPFACDRVMLPILLSAGHYGALPALVLSPLASLLFTNVPGTFPPEGLGITILSTGVLFLQIFVHYLQVF